MTPEDFNIVFEEQVERSRKMLVSKASEYATDDRLHNFKVGAKLTGGTYTSALSGLLAKHIVSIFDMCDRDAQFNSTDIWDEKITDSINYLILLKAIIAERDNELRTMDFRPNNPLSPTPIVINTSL